MLKIYSGGKFRPVPSLDKGNMPQFYRSLTKGDDGVSGRYVLDVIAPGFTESDVTVQVSPNLKSLKVTLIPCRRPPFDLDGDADNFGYNALKIRRGTVVETFAIDNTVYDLNTIKVEAHAGVIRVVMMKKAQPWKNVRVRGIC